MLYPAYLRDTLLRLAEAKAFNPLWSAEIFAELRRNLLDLGLDEAGVDRMLIRMRGRSTMPMWSATSAWLSR